MSRFQLVATAAFGLESVVARELKELGFDDISASNGYVEFTGDETAIMKSNLWLRSADRVLIKVGEFRATTFDALFEQTKALPWPDLLPRDAAFPVEGRSVKSMLASVPACQSIVKKAIVESLKRRYHQEMFAESGAVYPIEVALLKDRVMLTLDTSGAGLHRRGYRKLNSRAPIKETLAAALVLLSRWQPHRPFADPLCGSGTIAIEAAMIGRNIAPGLDRKFAFEEWHFINSQAWRAVRREAQTEIQFDTNVDVWASDIDAASVSLTKYHASRAGVEDCMTIQQLDVARFQPTDEYGCIVTNPPYGERLSDENAVKDLYRDMGQVFQRLQTWSYFIIASDSEFERHFGQAADKRRKLYNGRIETHFFQYLGPLPPRVHSEAELR